MSDEEEKFIKREEADQIARIRRERQLAALREEEREGIAKVLHTSDDVAAEALELGFDRETSRIIHLVPIIQIAWADGQIQSKEREKVLEFATAAGIDSDSGAYDFLELLLEKQPSSLFFERTNQVIAHMLADGGSAVQKDDIVEHARSIASAAGGFFGFGSVQEEEQKLIDNLIELLYD
jgi:hypothetical protein